MFGNAYIPEINVLTSILVVLRMPGRLIAWCWCIHSLSPKLNVRTQAVCVCTMHILRYPVNIMSRRRISWNPFLFGNKFKLMIIWYLVCHLVRVLSRSVLWMRKCEWRLSFSNQMKWNGEASAQKEETQRSRDTSLQIIIIKSRIRFSLCLDLHRIIKQSHSPLIWYWNSMEYISSI